MVALVFLAPKKVPTHNPEPYPMVVSLARPKCWLCKVSLTRIFRGRSLSDDKLGMIVVWNNGLLCTLVYDMSRIMRSISYTFRSWTPPRAVFNAFDYCSPASSFTVKVFWTSKAVKQGWHSSPVTRILNWDPPLLPVYLRALHVPPSFITVAFRD